MTIRHVVTWKLASEDPAERAEQAAEVARRLNGLAGAIPGLVSISAGANTLYPEVNWHVTLVADFADVAALEAYQVHPLHVEAAGYIKSVVAGRAAVDFEV